MARFLRIMDMLQLGLRESHLQVLMEAGIGASRSDMKKQSFES